MKQISVEELKNRLDNGEHLHIVDVREEEEYEEDNIGAIFLPLSDIVNYEVDEIDELKQEEVILHCRSGQRSMQAAMILQSLGFENVVNLIGGIMDWRAKYGSENLK